ncbi:hypothetical protein [Vibrio taketomensis]|uniref:hypothetical protein n=1 Tax=Vibrio taketomensis TaxID=2572923 RepID=UPI00138A0743|nr:hypothetical protein [Vibrio taketomensis]
MNKKLGTVMTSSRMVTFFAFLAAIFAWFLNMHALFTFTILALACAAYIYLADKYHQYAHRHDVVTIPVKHLPIIFEDKRPRMP